MRQDTDHLFALAHLHIATVSIQILTSETEFLPFGYDIVDGIIDAFPQGEMCIRDSL